MTIGSKCMGRTEAREVMCRKGGDVDKGGDLEQGG